MPSFFDWRDHFPFLSPLLSQVEAINAEVAAARQAKWSDWPETNLYMRDQGQSWRVIPFCYTFPSNTGVTQWVESSSALLPGTVRTLKAIPGLKTALLSRMGPSTTLVPHDGWREISNHVLRCHLALDIPGPRVSGVAIDEELMFHEQGKILCFDDAKVHSGFNLHPEKERTVLIFDIARPPGVATGIASGGATAELQSFMDYFS